MLIQTIRFALLLALIAMSSSCTTSYTTTYYIVRHAEKADKTRDTPLSLEGHARAITLRDTLIDQNIEKVFVTNYLRTQQTVAPLTIELGITPIEVFANQTPQLIQQLKAIKGKNVLIAGHSNTVPEIIDELMEKPQNVTITEEDFDNLFKVEITKNKNETTRDFTQLIYGVHTK